METDNSTPNQQPALAPEQNPQPAPVLASTPAAVETPAKHADMEIFRKINRVTALTLVVCAMLFAVVSILSIWQVFGKDNGEIVWRSLSSLATVAFAALVVNVASKLVENNHK